MQQPSEEANWHRIAVPDSRLHVCVQATPALRSTPTNPLASALAHAASRGQPGATSIEGGAANGPGGGLQRVLALTRPSEPDTPPAGASSDDSGKNLTSKNLQARTSQMDPHCKPHTQIVY